MRLVDGACPKDAEINNVTWPSFATLSASQLDVRFALDSTISRPEGVVSRAELLCIIPCPMNDTQGEIELL